MALIGRNVGLLKLGQGTLVLSGYDTYLGATVVRGGELSLSRQTDVAASGTLVNSNVFVESGGLLTGDGTVANAVSNQGTLLPGEDLGSGFTAGTYTQQGPTGLTVMQVDAQGQHTNLTANQMAFNGGRISLAATPGYYANGNLPFSFSSLFTGAVSTAGFNWQTDVVAGWYNPAQGKGLAWTSPTLTSGVAVVQSGSATPSGLTLTMTRAPGAYSRYATDANSRAVGVVFDQAAGQVQGDAQNLVAALDFSADNGSDVITRRP